MRGEYLEPRRCLTTYSMVPHEIVTGTRFNDAEFVDFNRDGTLDIVSSHWGGGIDLMLGRARLDFEPQRTVYEAGELLAAVDVDSDLDVDLVIIEDDELVWLEHDLVQQRLTRHLIAEDVQRISRLQVDDVDRNGVVDFVFSESDKPGLRFLLGSESEVAEIHWDATTFAPEADRFTHLYLNDLDGDEDLDLVLLSQGFAWRYSFNDDQFGDPMMLTGLPAERPIDFVVDLDDDRQVEVITWDGIYELDGDEFALRQQYDVPSGFGRPKAVTSDWNGDGRIDIVWEVDVSAGDEAAEFHISRQLQDGTLAHPTRLFQVVQDYNDWSLVPREAGSPEIVFFRIDGSLIGRRTQANSTEYVATPRSHTPLTTTSDAGSFLTLDSLPSNAEGGPTNYRISSWRLGDDGSFESVDLAGFHDFGRVLQLVGDFNGDGAQDLVVWGETQRWLLAGDGSGSYGEPTDVSFEPTLDEMVVANLDGDDRDELISYRRAFRGELYVHELDPATGIWASRPLLVAGPFAQIETGDVDADGRGDVVVNDPEGLSWHRQLPSGEFGSAQNLSHRYDRVVLEDVNRDGQIDIVAFDSDGADQVMTFINQAGTFSPVATGLEVDSRIFDAAVADVDDDGDRDLLLQKQSVLCWAENIDGLGQFAPVSVLIELPSSSDFANADVDRDGDVDLITNLGGGNLTWFERRVLGDANADGQFDSADLVQILARGHYETNSYQAVTYDDGDFNLDGRVDSNDLVLAFIG